MAFLHRDVGDVSTPYLIDLLDGSIAQQIGVDVVFLVGLARAGLWHKGCNPHDFHQPAETVTAHS